MTSIYGLSGSFGSRVRSKSIGYNTYTVRGSNFCSKPTPIHGLFHKYDLNYSYSRSHFNRLPQVVARKLMYSLSQKVSYASKIIDTVINGFSPHEVIIHLNICDSSIVTFVIGG